MPVEAEENHEKYQSASVMCGPMYTPGNDRLAAPKGGVVSPHALCCCTHKAAPRLSCPYSTWQEEVTVLHRLLCKIRHILVLYLTNFVFTLKQLNKVSSFITFGPTSRWEGLVAASGLEEVGNPCTIRFTEVFVCLKGAPAGHFTQALI